MLLLFIDEAQSDEDDEEDVAEDDNETISLFKSTIGACFVERIHWKKTWLSEIFMFCLK